MGSRPAPRQRRLVEDDLPSIANARVVRKPLLSASTLSSWLYCHTKPFVERVLQVLGVDASTPAMRAGARAHGEVQGALEAVAAPSELTLAEALQRGEFRFEAERHLIDKRRRMHGFVDLVYTHEHRLHILELKNSRAPMRLDPLWRAPVWTEHGLQLHFYGILGRSEFGATPLLSLTYLQGGNKQVVLRELSESRDPEIALRKLSDASVALPQTREDRTRVLLEVAGFRSAERASSIPDPHHANPRRCAECTVRNWCPKRLDEPGRFVELDPALLEGA